MKIVMGTTNAVTADLHQWAEGDVVLVRFEPSDTNLPQDMMYHDDESRSRKRRQQRSENWVWFAGKVKRVNSAGDIFVKFYDGDTITIRSADTRLDVKRTTGKRLNSMFDEPKFSGTITNKQMVALTAPLKARPLEEVLEVDSNSFEGDLLLPVSKMTISTKLVSAAYEDNEWLGAWINAPVYDAYKKKYILPAVIVGFGLVRGKHSLLLKADTTGLEHFRTPWSAIEVFDRDTEVLFEKIDRMATAAKSKLKRDRVSLQELMALRKEAKKSKRFV